MEENMPFDITPNLETFIRVRMSYKGSKEKVEVIPQKIKNPERNGFTVVEWGETEIK